MASALSVSAATSGLSVRNAAIPCPEIRTRRRPTLAMARIRRPVEETFNIQVERNVPKERLDELGVWRWSKWEAGKCELAWDWHVDQQVYIVKGRVKVVPEGCDRAAWFYEGDLLRYPKWFVADLYFDGPYEERYRFRAYGDD